MSKKFVVVKIKCKKCGEEIIVSKYLKGLGALTFTAKILKHVIQCSDIFEPTMGIMKEENLD